MTLNAGSTETHCCESLPIDHALGRHIVVAFVGANCSSRLRPHDSIDGTMIVPSASKSTLHLDNYVGIGISVIVVTVVIVVVVPIIGIRIEERETKRVEENERSIMETAEAIVTIIVAIVPKPGRRIASSFVRRVGPQMQGLQLSSARRHLLRKACVLFS